MNILPLISKMGVGVAGGGLGFPTGLKYLSVGSGWTPPLSVLGGSALNNNLEKFPYQYA